MLDYQRDGNVAVLAIDDGKANAVSHGLLDGLHAALDRAEKDAAAVVLLGRKGIFSGGFDLKELDKGPEAAGKLVGRGAEMFLRLYSHPQPLVAACTGHAVAAGAFMLLSSDTRVGVEGDFKIGLNETALGMTFPVFAFELAHARLSKRHLTAAFIQSNLYGPADAVDAGFLDRTVTAGQIRDAALETATALAELPGAAYARNKRDIRASAIAAIRASLTPSETMA